VQVGLTMIDIKQHPPSIKTTSQPKDVKTKANDKKI